MSNEQDTGYVDNDSPRTEASTRGGCLKLGWGCLPVWMGLMLLPAGLWLY